MTRGTERARPVEIVGAGPRLELVGDFDVRSTGRVRSAIDEALVHHDRVVVDLAGVDNVDLTALRVLAAAGRRAARAGHRLAVASPQPGVRRLMHLSHLARLMEVESVASPA
ncbi:MULTISPECIES: STAS domain-containing protein [unclassified Nocardioides]|uniref:STAS domain-containing protein n=1 Tax=unclassified Nocardioides TaxID=2615069 RepID=UPI002404CBD5|nr:MULTISPECIES: STAS domain-containing protein [unclassified Nocardioides]